MIKRIVILCSCVFFALSLFALAPMKTERERVDKLMRNRNYSDAITLIDEMLILHPENAEFNFMLGVCFYHATNDVSKAIAQLEKTHKITERRKLLIEVKFFLAKAYHINMQFDKAINMYDSIKELLFARNKRKRKEVDVLVDRCKYAKKMCAMPLNVDFTLLGSIINTSADEHTPCLSADERFMIYTSRKKASSDSVAIDGKYYENIYYSICDGNNWNSPKLLTDGTSASHKASVSISFDGRTMILYKANSDDVSNAGGDFYISYRTGYKWSTPIKLSDNINSLSRETHASLSADGNTIYFSSDRPGGMGGMDIYKSVKSESGNWGVATNLGGKINTIDDEISPYIHADGRTLYFSSNRKLTVGGFDIFSSDLINGEWIDSENMGYPINSTRDDIYFNITADGKRAYMASRRSEGQGLLDLYKINMRNTEPKKIFIITGNVGDVDTNIPRKSYTIRITSTHGDDITVFPDSETGEFIFAVDADKSYSVDYSKAGFETMNTLLMFPHSYYNEINHGIIPLNLISLNNKEGEYQQKDLTADLKACGFRDGNDLPKINGSVGILKILNEVPTHYTVQIMAMKRPLPLSYFAKIGNNLSAVLGSDGITRYLYKSYRDKDEAQAVMMLFRDMGFWDAFVREFKGGMPGRTLDDCEVMGNNSPIRPW